MKKFALPLLLVLAVFLQTVQAAEPIPSLGKPALDKLLADNRDKVIMLNFFATWCPPCRAEIPEIVQLRKNTPKRDLLIIGLSVDKGTEEVQKFLAATKINYPVYMAGPDITSAYGVTSVPHNAFYAPGGKLIISEPGIANFDVLKQTVSDLAR